MRTAANALNQLGIVMMDKRDFAQARVYYEQARDLLHAIGAHARENALLGNLGLIAAAQYDFVSAEAYYLERFPD